MKRLFSSVPPALAFVALMISGCTSSEEAPFSNVGSRAEISVTMVPDSVRAVGNTGTDAATHPYMASFEVVVAETAGVSCNMISQTLVAAPDPGNLKVRGAASSATIPGRASIRIPMTIVYAKVPSGGAMTVSLTVNVIDVTGNVTNGIGTVRVSQ